MTDQSPTDQVPDDSLGQIAQRLDSLIQTFEQHPIVQVRDEAMEMLALIDALHREGLRHLVQAFQAHSAEQPQESPTCSINRHSTQLLEDPAVYMLLMLYDLLPPEPREQVEQILEAIGPYIASQGCSVEVLDVADGVVHLHLDGGSQGNAGLMTKITQDIEMALREGFPGFRSIEVHEQAKVKEPVQSGGFIPLQQVRPTARTLNRPVYTSVALVESIPPGTLKGIEAEGQRFLLCNLDGDIYAYRNACSGSILPLDVGQLKGYTLLCPWHNCVYDLRTGKRLDGGTGRLEVIPVAIRDGMIQLALSVQPMSVRQAVGKPKEG